MIFHMLDTMPSAQLATVKICLLTMGVIAIMLIMYAIEANKYRFEHLATILAARKHAIFDRFSEDYEDRYCNCPDYADKRAYLDSCVKKKK